MKARQCWLLVWVLLALPFTAQQYPSQVWIPGATVANQGGNINHVNLFNGQLSLTTHGSTLTTSVNASTNRLISFSALYDAGGNLTRQIRGSETHQYTYDPLGMPNGEDVYHFHADHLGTPRQITNASGVQVALHSYYPFGQEATDPAQTSFTKKFTGHERDSNGTGTAGDLDYMHARYGSPTLARFLSFDPIGGNPRAPQSWNRYAYALNSPINYTDPEGLFAALFFDLLFVVFDEVTVTASSYSNLIGLFHQLGGYFSEGVRPSIYGELGRPTPPVAGALRGLFDGDELERVRFGMSYGAIDTGGVPEFVIFLPVGRISNALRGSALRAGSTTARGGTYILKCVFRRLRPPIPMQGDPWHERSVVGASSSQ